MTSPKLTIFKREFVEGVLVDEVPPHVDVDGLALQEVAHFSLLLVPVLSDQILEQLK